MSEILRRLATPNNLPKQQYLSILNEFSRQCRETGLPPVDEIDDDFLFLKNALFHDAAEVRAAALRAIRYLLKDESSIKSLLKSNLPIFIVRSIDIVLENRTERIQALRLVRKYLSISPHSFPTAFTRSLIAIAQDGQVEHDTLTRACWALLAELSIMSPTSSTKDTQNCAFNAIMDAALAGNQPHGMCESLISSLLYMLNWPRYRCLIRGDLDLQIFVAPFTDSHYTAPISKDPSKQRVNQSTKFDVEPFDQRENKFTASKITLISILRSWQGLIYLCEPQSSECNLVSNSCLKSLINMLYLPYNDVRKRLIDLIFELLYLPLPDSSCDFETGLKFLEKHQLSKDSWKIHDAFVVDEAKAILSPLRSRSRLNLVSNYIALLLVALFHCNVVDALSEVIITPSHENSVRATLLLYQLLSLSYQYLPTDSFSQYLTLSKLIAHATSKVDDSRDLANAALINLGRVHPLKKSSNYTNAKCSIFLGQILEFCSPHLFVENSNNYISSSNTLTSTFSASNTSNTLSSLASTSSNQQSSIYSSNNNNINSNHYNSSSAATLINMELPARSPSISSRSPSFLSKSPSISAATSLFTLFTFQQSTTKSNLKTIIEQDWQNWEWEHINFILTRPNDAMKKMTSQYYKAFLKRLVHFFKPSSNQYSMIDINNERCKQLCETGCNMVDFLAASSDPKATDLLRELLHDISISMHDSENNIVNVIHPYHLHNNNNHHNNYNINNSVGNSNPNSNTNSIMSQTTLGGNHQHHHSLSAQHQQQHHPAPRSTNSNDTNILSSSKLITTMSSTYFLFIGRLSSTVKGFELLEKSSIMKLIKNLTQTSMFATSPAEVYVRLIISCFDYTKEFNGSRKLLEKFLFHHPEDSVRIYATNFLRVLLRANVPDFANWAIELLLKQLDSPLRVVHYVAADILDEACDLDENLEGLISQKSIADIKNPQTTKNVLVVLRSTGDSGILLLCRYASSPNGLRYLIETPRQRLSYPLDSVLNGITTSTTTNSTPRTNTTTAITPNISSTLTTNTTNTTTTLTATTSISTSILASRRNGTKTNDDDNNKPKATTSSIPPTSPTSSTLSSSTSSSSKARSTKTTPTNNPTDKERSHTNSPPILSAKNIIEVESEFDVELDRWQTVFNYRYVKLVEDVLNNSLTYHQKGEDGKYGRRIDRINPLNKNSFLPPHLYGQLALHQEGIDIIRNRKLLEPIYDILFNPPEDLNYSEASVIKFKAALWIIGHVGGSETGYQELRNSRELIGLITEIAKTASVLSLRGTAFYVLGLLGDTEEGKEEVKLYNWIVQENMIALPLTLNLILTKPHDDNDEIVYHTNDDIITKNQSLDLHPLLKDTYRESELEGIRKDVLKYVSCLSGSLAQRPSEMNLLDLKRRYGPVFQYDLSLYSDVCSLLASYNFRLQARRFLQELFLN